VPRGAARALWCWAAFNLKLRRRCFMRMLAGVIFPLRGRKSTWGQLLNAGLTQLFYNLDSDCRVVHPNEQAKFGKPCLTRKLCKITHILP